MASGDRPFAFTGIEPREPARKGQPMTPERYVGQSSSHYAGYEPLLCGAEPVLRHAFAAGITGNGGNGLVGASAVPGKHS